VAHDFAFVHGGAEWVTQVLTKEFLPQSQLLALGGNRTILDGLQNDRTAESVFRNPWISERTYRVATPLYPVLLNRRSPCPGNVLASSYAFAHHVKAEGSLVVYCHTPLRQAWTGYERYATCGPLRERLGVRLISPSLQRADRKASARADVYIATSRAVRDRLAKIYGRVDAPIVAPPIDDRVFRYDRRPREDFYLFVGRITEPYKRLKPLIAAFEEMPGRRLLVVGDGRDRRKLQSSAPGNVTFLGWRGHEETASLYNKARALLFPSEDDFGIVPVEAMACGLPVIAYGRGGALDTVQEGVTGLFFGDHSSQSIRQAIVSSEQFTWDSKKIAAHGGTYSRKGFVAKMTRIFDANGLW
jgi:glycosyltransferase involved in cell wall biosynthesis